MLTVAMVLLPETPYWLIEYNQFEKAKKSLRFFRGSEYDINPEFNEIHQRHLSKDKNQSCSWMLQRLFSKAFLKPFMCSGVIYMIFTVSGFDIIIIYMVTILQETGSSVDPNIGTMVTAIFLMFFKFLWEYSILGKKSN